MKLLLPENQLKDAFPSCSTLICLYSRTWKHLRTRCSLASIEAIHRQTGKPVLSYTFSVGTVLITPPWSFPYASLLAGRTPRAREAAGNQEVPAEHDSLKESETATCKIFAE